MVFSLALGFALLACIVLGLSSGKSLSPPLKMLFWVPSIICFALWWYRRRPGESITAASIVGALLVVVLVFSVLALSIGPLPSRSVIGALLGLNLLLGLVTLGLHHYRQSFELAEAARKTSVPTHGFSIGIGVVLLAQAYFRFAGGNASGSSNTFFTPVYRLSETVIGPQGPATVFAAIGIAMILYGLLVRK